MRCKREKKKKTGQLNACVSLLQSAFSALFSFETGCAALQMFCNLHRILTGQKTLWNNANFGHGMTNKNGLQIFAALRKKAIATLRNNEGDDHDHVTNLHI